MKQGRERKWAWRAGIEYPSPLVPARLSAAFRYAGVGQGEGDQVSRRVGLRADPSPAGTVACPTNNRGSTVALCLVLLALHVLAGPAFAQPCEKPTSERIGLLVGDARCWAVLFPDRKRRAA